MELSRKSKPRVVSFQNMAYGIGQQQLKKETRSVVNTDLNLDYRPSYLCANWKAHVSDQGRNLKVTSRST